MRTGAPWIGATPGELEQRTFGKIRHPLVRSSVAVASSIASAVALYACGTSEDTPLPAENEAGETLVAESGTDTSSFDSATVSDSAHDAEAEADPTPS